MLYLLISVYRDSGKLQNQIDIDKEREHQLEASKEKDKMNDDQLLEWLEKQKKKEKGNK